MTQRVKEGNETKVYVIVDLLVQAKNLLGAQSNVQQRHKRFDSHALRNTHTHLSS